jgi:magnesium chelatase family protein
LETWNSDTIRAQTRGVKDADVAATGRQYATRLGLSARAHDRILKVARTIADLDASPDIIPKHLSEAIQYRTLDRSYWS